MNHNILADLALQKEGRSRSINAENPNGGKGCGGIAGSNLGESRKGSPCIPVIKSGENKLLADIKGPAIIEHIWMTVTNKISDKNCFVLRDLILRMYWEDEDKPSIECPLGDFFCNGFAVSYCVNSLPIVVNPTRGFNSYFQMPFNKRARIYIENQGNDDIPSFFYQIDYCEYDNDFSDIAYLHATWRRQKITNKTKDYVILDNVRGKGHYVGTFIALSSMERYWWGEGEMKFYLDGDQKYPTICGTGTEDYFGGAWSFGESNNGIMNEKTYQTPFLGYPFLSRTDESVHNDYHMNDCPTMHALYRFHILDAIRFEQDIKVTLQQIGSCHRGLFERQDDVSSVAYWYQNEPHILYSELPVKEERWPR